MSGGHHQGAEREENAARHATESHRMPLSAKQEKFLAALLNSPTNRDAAAAAGVSERSASRWLHEDRTFIAAYSQARRGLLDEAHSLLLKNATGAANTLVCLMEDGSPPAVRLGAARSLLEFSRQHIDIIEIERRIAELEKPTDEDDAAAPGASGEA